jgi:hypothetical protein
VGLISDRLVANVPSLSGFAARLADWSIRGLLAFARPGSPLRRGVDWVLGLPVSSLVAYLIFVALMLGTVDALAKDGDMLYLLALLAIPAGAFLLRRPVLLGLAIAAASIWIRMVYLGHPETCDQLAVSRAALDVVVRGGNPYGFGYAESVPPGAPYPYGPLGMVTALLGQPGETLAFAVMAFILVWQRALFTLILFGAQLSWVELGACGMNDMVPSVLLLSGLLLVERRRLIPGAMLVALSAGIKPYTFAWFPPLVGFGGVTAILTLTIAAGIAWLPVAIWGIRSYLDSVQGAWAVQHAQPQNTLDMPILKFLAVPLVLLSLLVRSWEAMVLTGAAIFGVMMLTDYWMSYGYWMVVLPPVGIVLERALQRYGVALREAAAAQRVVVASPSPA